MAEALGIAVGTFGRVALLSATQPVMDHAHSQVHALIKLSGPDTVYEVDGRGAKLSDTQMVLVNPWVVHSNSRAAGNEPTVLLALYLDTLWFGDLGSQILMGSNDLPFAETTATVSPQLRDQAIQLADQMTSMQSDDDHFDTSLRDLFGMVLHSSKTDARSLQSTERSFVSDYRIRKAIKLFHQQPAKDLDLNDVARAIGLSRSQFYERFRLCTGLSPRTYLDTLCCERAALLLSDPSPHDRRDLGSDRVFGPGSFHTVLQGQDRRAPKELSHGSYRSRAYSEMKAFPVVRIGRPPHH